MKKVLALLATEGVAEVGGVSAVDEVVDGPGVGGSIDGLDGVPESNPGGKVSVSLDGERDGDLKVRQPLQVTNLF